MSISLRRMNSSAIGVRLVRLFVLLPLLLLAGAFMQAQAAGIVLVQHVGKDAGTTTTSTLAFAGLNTAGNFIAVVIRGGLSNSQVFTITDSNGNTYKQAAQIGSSASAVTTAIYYAENVKGGANTVTASMTVSGPLRFAILEYSGVATANSLDTTAVATATSTSPNSGNATTTASGDLLLGAVAAADSTAFTAGSGYTIRDSVPAAPNTKLISEDQIQGAAGTVSASATLNPSSNWGAILAAFKAAAGVAGSPATIAATAGTPQNATIGNAFGTQLQAAVKDSFNNPVSGATVTFTAPGSGASGTFANGTGSTTATTDASGVATSSTFTANTVAGGYTVTASVSGVAPANFTLTNLAGAPASITATAGTPQSAAINTAFATQLQATVIDSLNNPVSGVTVTFTAPNSGASGTFAGGVNTATTNAQGIATAPLFTANGTTGGPYTVTASVSGVAAQASFSLTNLASSPFTWGNMDEWLQMNTSSPGTALTSAILAAGSVGTPAMSSWTLDQSNSVVSSTSAFTVAASQGSMAGSVTVNGVTYPVGTPTQSLALSNNVNFTYVTTNKISGVKQVVANGFVTFGQANAGTAGGKNIDAVLLNDTNSGAAVVLQLNNGNPCYCVRVESNGAVGFHHSGNITVVQGHRYSFSLLFDEIGGSAKLAIFDPSNNFAQVGSTATVAQNTGFNFSSFRFGNAEAGTSSGTTTYFEDLMLDWTNHVFPNIPHVSGGGGTPSTITATAGTPQSATVGTAFAVQLQATVKDSLSNPVSGATVTFTAPGSGASGTFAGGVITATTNASGVATAAVFTANTTAGSYVVNATVSGVASPANFSLTNLPGAAASITATAGTPQSATVNTAFATQLQATVKDSFGNGVSGATVTFAAPGSGASGTFAGSVNTATTNASGVATAVAFTANTTAGAYAVTASVSGVAGSANYSLTNLAGAASSITATAGTPQSTTVNTAFAAQLQATVKDSFNNPVSSVTVTFAAPGSGASGTFAGGVKTATTNASGLATAAAFTANTTAGAYTVAASVSGVASPANFSLTNLAGSAANITATAGTPQSASINTAFATQLQATVKDSFGNGVSGVAVTFTAPGNGASGTFAGGVNTAITDASGVATAAVFTANGTAGGPYTVTAAASGVAGSASFSLTNLGNPPANIVASAGTPQSATINTAFAAQLQVTVTDSGNNPVSGVTVTFTAPGSGASGTFAGGSNTAVTNASGIATSAVFTANSTAGSYAVTATVSGVASPANFSLTNLTGAAASITATAGTPQSATVNTALTTQLQATVKDAGGNPVNGVTVTFAAPGSGASGTFAGGLNTATTNASGIATAAMFTANNTAGTYIVTASAAGVASPANFSLTNLAGAAASIAATAGTPQSATINTAFAVQLQATVMDSFNNPVSGVTVTFTAPNSGASGTFAGGVNTATTNASGVATAPIFTANSVAGGPYTVTASVSGVGTSASFSLTNTASVAIPIALVQHTSKDHGTTTSGTLAFASANTAGNFIAVAIRGGQSNSQVFTVSDSNSNTYKQAKQLGSSGSAVTTAIYYAENIKGGANSVTVTMSVSGPMRFAILEYSNVASSNSLDATAAATNTSTSPNSGNLITTVSGDLLLATVATADSETFTAGTGFTIRDVIPATGSKIITEDQVQSAAGTASASATLSASSNWGAVLAAFKSASGGGGAGVPASITATAGTPQSATVNTAFALQLQAAVKDSLNNPVSGVTVTFAAPGSGASGTFAGGATTATTNGSGVATAAIFTANTVAGGYTVTASVSGVSTPANFSLTNLAGAASSITATAGTPQSATINTAFAAQLQATVKDSFSNPVSGVTVTFTAPGSGASGTFAGGVNTATTNSSGIATAAVFTANGTTGSYTVTASVSGVGTGASFSLTNTANPTPSISTLSLTQGPVGATFTVSGSNFGSPQGSSTVTLGGTPMSAANWTANSFDVTVPSGASTGPVVVTVGGVQSNGVTFTVTPPPAITSIAPTSGPVGTNVVITGTNFGPTVGTIQSFVTIGGIQTRASNWSNTSITAPVPASATTGNVLVYVGGVPSNGILFTVTPPPSITSLSPTFGPVGTSVTINGANFGASQGTTTVTFNGVNAGTAASWSTTSIVIPVPSGATTGNVVVTESGVPSNGVVFTVTSTSGNIALVQHRNIDIATATSGVLAFGANTTAGNWIGVCIRGGLSSSQVFTISDSSGNTYQQAFQLGLATAVTFACYYAENIKGGADTITVTQSVSGPLRFAISEYSNVATSNSLDATPAVAQGNNTSPNSGNLTTGAGGDLLLGIVVTTNSGSFTAGTGYTIEDTVPAPPNTKMIVEDQLQSSAGTASASASLAGADNWGAGLAAFRSINGTSLPISVSVSPASASVPSGYGTQSFTATISNDFQNRGATWSLSGAGCSGSTCGTLTQVTTTSATYNAPANVPSPATVTLTATAIGDTTKSASATITLTQGVLHVSISPRRAAATMSASQTVQFNATVVNDPQNLGVTWQVDGNNGGTAATGTISATGLFTPGTQPGAHTVAAVSNANASITASALMAVTDLAGVYNHHNDNAGTGQNLKEYGLTPATVTPSTFGQLFSCPVDGFVYAEPLWVANLNVAGVTRNVVFIATEHNSVYAFDADSPACVQLWKVSFINPPNVDVLTPVRDVHNNGDIVPELGITSTPVIDPATNTIYVVANTREIVGTVNGVACSTTSPCYPYRLHAMDLTTGAEKTTFNSPAVISANNFDPHQHLQRPALLLVNNTVYIAFGSHGDFNPYYGWLMGYDPATLARKFVTVFSTGGFNRGGIWQSGAGPVADASGNIYFSTGNGQYDGSTNFGDTALKMGPNGSLPPIDWFTPFNQSTFNANDIDLASSGILILPSSVGSTTHPNLAIATGKVAILYLLDIGTCSPQPCTTMGKFNSSANNDVQEVIPVPPPNTTLLDGGNYGLPAYWNGNIYTTGQNFPLSQFQISNANPACPSGTAGTTCFISPTQSAKSSNMFPPRGGIPSVSANGTTGGVVWIVDFTGWQNNTTAILDAYDATSVANLLYSSPSTGAGAAGPAVKWSVATVANGKVYVGGQFVFTVFGLLP